MFFGGSFVSRAEKPHDLDTLIVFPHQEAIPHKSELLTVESTRIDIQFCAESDRRLVDAFVHLLTHTRGREHIGIVQVDLYSQAEPWCILHEPDDTQVEIVKRAYIQRHYVDHYEPNGVLVTIHGVLSKAKWNAEIAPIASSQNWVFAPFVYVNENSPDEVSSFNSILSSQALQRIQSTRSRCQTRISYRFLCATLQLHIVRRES